MKRTDIPVPSRIASAYAWRVLGIFSMFLRDDDWICKSTDCSQTELHSPYVLFELGITRSSFYFRALRFLLLEALAILFDLRSNRGRLLFVLGLHDLVLDLESSLALFLASVGCTALAFGVACALRRSFTIFFPRLSVVRLPGVVD